MTSLVRILAGMAVALFVTMPVAAIAQDQAKPNILFIMGDDIG